jgi:hypothetical protein
MFLRAVAGLFWKVMNQMLMTTVKSDPDTIVPEYQWRGQYVAALIKSGAPLKEIYLQSELAASLALDALGRD